MVDVLVIRVSLYSHQIDVLGAETVEKEFQFLTF